MTVKTFPIALIDPVGCKAGMDNYDLLLLRGLHHHGNDVYLYSNFKYNGADIRYKQVFFNTGVSKINAILSNFWGFFKAFADARKNKVKWLILHVFRAGIFDLFTFALARLLGFKILAIVHDIESLDTITVPFVRKSVIGILPTIRVVHNQFSKDQLSKSISKKSAEKTFVVPHVNFTEIFSSYHVNPSSVEKLKDNQTVLNKLHPRLPELVREKKQIILFFGQIKKAKGLDVLINALPYCTEDFTLIIAGKLRDEHWDRYDALISKQQLTDKVLPVIRHISDEERDILFAISTGIVLPYRVIYQSGVLLMAMSFPITVIASDLAPNKDLIQENKNGLLFKSEDAKNLAQKIDLLLSDASLMSRLSKQALEDVKEKYSSNKVGELMANCFSE